MSFQIVAFCGECLTKPTDASFALRITLLSGLTVARFRIKLLRMLLHVVFEVRNIFFSTYLPAWLEKFRISTLTYRSTSIFIFRTMQIKLKSVKLWKMTLLANCYFILRKILSWAVDNCNNWSRFANQKSSHGTQNSNPSGSLSCQNF